VSLLTTAINDRHASKMNGFRSTAGIIRNDQWPPDSPEPWTIIMGRDVGGLLQAPSETQVNHQTQTRSSADADKPARHT